MYFRYQASLFEAYWRQALQLICNNVSDREKIRQSIYPQHGFSTLRKVQVGYKGLPETNNTAYYLYIFCGTEKKYLSVKLEPTQSVVLFNLASNPCAQKFDFARNKHSSLFVQSVNEIKGFYINFIKNFFMSLMFQINKLEYLYFVTFFNIV